MHPASIEGAIVAAAERRNCGGLDLAARGCFLAVRVVLGKDMYKAVIWDFGGVFTSSPFEAFARYERERNIPVGTIRKINSTNPETNAWAQFEQSKVDIDGFDRLFLAEAA